MASWDFWWQGQSTNSEDVVLSHLLTMTRAQLDNGYESTQQQQGVLLLLTVRIAKIGLNYFQLTFWYCKGYRLGHTWQSPSCKNYPAHPLTLDVVLAATLLPEVVPTLSKWELHSNQSELRICLWLRQISCHNSGDRPILSDISIHQSPTLDVTR